MALLGLRDPAGDFLGGGGVDCGAVDEDAVAGRDGVEEGGEDLFDVNGFGEDGDDGVLFEVNQLAGRRLKYAERRECLGGG